MCANKKATMQKKYVFSFVIMLIMVSCGSSRRAARLQKEPDIRQTTLDKTVPHKEVVTTSTPKSKKDQKSKPQLAQRIDSLIYSADTLLQFSQLGLHIVDLTTGQVVYTRNAGHRMRPASTEKLVTAISALDILGPSYQFSTQLLSAASVSGGTLQGDLYIKGVMDPLLTTADVRALASQLKATGIRRITGRLVADASFKDADELGWGWCWDDENPTLSPLLINGKTGLPAALRNALKNVGITVSKGTASGVAPANARELAACRRPITAVLQPMMKESDNLCAEAVFYQLGKTRKQIAPLINNLTGALSTIADGSGLSLYNYQTPETFTRLLTYAAARPDSIFNPLLEALPIAAVDGTLKKRMADTPAAANVRAKTGSVSAVSTLAGYTTQRSTGHLIAFAIMNQGVERMAQGRAFQDQICILLSE